MSIDQQHNHPTENDKSAFVIAYAVVAASGAVVGFLAGWLLR